MFLILNLLWIVIDWSFFMSSSNPNEDNTNFQILVSFISLLATLMTANINSEIVFVVGMSVFLFNLLVSLPMIFLMNNSISSKKSSEYKAKITTNETNSISENETITLIFPWRGYHFGNTTLNPKFINKYYELQNKEKRNFFEYSTFTLLKEYFYFKSLKSYYIRKL